MSQGTDKHCAYTHIGRPQTNLKEFGPNPQLCPRLSLLLCNLVVFHQQYLIIVLTKYCYFICEAALFQISGSNMTIHVLGQTKRFLRGCENFLPALAKLLCLALPGSCLAKHSSLLEQLSSCRQYWADSARTYSRYSLVCGTWDKKKSAI